MPGTVGVSTDTPPELNSARGEKIIRFDLTYQRYLQQLRTINLNRTASRKIKPCGINSCVSAELLLSLTIPKTFPGFSTVREVTDKQVQEWIESRTRCSAQYMATHVSNAIRRIRIRPDRLDPHGAACQVFTDVITTLCLKRVEHAITEASKAVMSQLNPKFESKFVRETI